LESIREVWIHDEQLNQRHPIAMLNIGKMDPLGSPTGQTYRREYSACDPALLVRIEAVRLEQGPLLRALGAFPVGGLRGWAYPCPRTA